MNKQISVVLVVILAIVIVGVYLFSAVGSDNSGLDKQNELSSTETINLNIVINGPVGVATGANGEYLVDKNGLTLYVSIKDENPSGKISQSCNSQCEKTWPPYLLEENETAITSTTDPLLSKLNYLVRSDGRQQYTLGTQPLYRYVDDLKIGDVKGDTGDDWKVAKP